MDLTQARRLIVFGGSFDPPHIAHEQLPALAMQAINADVVVYVPAARQPLKLDGEHTSALHRLAMLRLRGSKVPISAGPRPCREVSSLSPRAMRQGRS